MREYRADDDIRQLNWRATARLGRPMSNNLRVEQDSDVWVLIDSGRLSAASLTTPTGPAVRLDLFLDAAAAVGLVADDLNDRVGFVSYAGSVTHQFPPRRRGGASAIEAGFALDAVEEESNHSAAFVAANSSRRSLILVFTDVLDASAARDLVAALPSISRRHDVVVCFFDDPEYPEARAANSLGTRHVMSDIDAATNEAVRLIRSAGAQVLRSASTDFSEAVVRSYVNRRSGFSTITYQLALSTEAVRTGALPEPRHSSNVQ